MFEIDVKDRKILYQLDLNSRQSLNTIGSNVSTDENRLSNIELTD